jgi:SAM-dependent methyltransferase
MIDTAPKVREHYNPSGLTDRIKAALTAIVPDGQPLTVDELAPLDQFHIRGMLATSELASAAGAESSTRVLDIGCGIGGPARSIAATFECSVIGIDLSPSFIDTANYLTMRCGLSSRVTFHVGNALHLPFDDAAFDVVFLQHVAMNILDRTALYDEIHRVLTSGGRFATYDLVLREGDIAYPVPWARDTSASFLLSEGDTRMSLEKAGFTPVFWRDDTEIALDWFKTTMTGPPQNGMNLGVVMGADMREMASNLARNLREDRLGVLSAVLKRD